jgi:hypothetical protein
MEGINKARILERTELLKPHRTRRDPIHRVWCIMTYNPSMPNISQHLRDHWPILLADKKSAFKMKQPIIAYERPQNIRDLLVKSLFCPPLRNTENSNKGSCKCTKKCITCSYMKNTTTFKSKNNNMRFSILSTIDCQTENVIYLIECQKCMAQYVGETKNTINYRLIRHRASHKARKEEPVAEHFNSTNHNIRELTITGIEKI